MLARYVIDWSLSHDWCIGVCRGRLLVWDHGRLCSWIGSARQLRGWAGY